MTTTTTTTDTKVIYTTSCGMFRVVEKNGAFYPEEIIVRVAGVGRLRNQAEVERYQRSYQENGLDRVRFGSWEGWFLGYTQRNENKGYKNYKSAKAAIKYVDQCSENLQDA